MLLFCRLYLLYACSLRSLRFASLVKSDGSCATSRCMLCRVVCCVALYAVSRCMLCRVVCCVALYAVSRCMLSRFALSCSRFNLRFAGVMVIERSWRRWGAQPPLLKIENDLFV